MGEGGGEKRKLSPLFTFIFPHFPQKRLILRLRSSPLVGRSVAWRVTTLTTAAKETTSLGPVARSLVSANRWLRGIKMYRFPWYLTLVSTNHASSNPGLVALKGKLGFEALWDFSWIIFLINPTVHCALIFPPMACAGKNLVARREICANFKFNLQNFDGLWLEYLWKNLKDKNLKVTGQLHRWEQLFFLYKLWTNAPFCQSER